MLKTWQQFNEGLSHNKDGRTIIEEKAIKIWDSHKYDDIIKEIEEIYGKGDDYNPNAIWKSGFENGFIECAKVFNIEQIVDDIEKYNL